MSGESDGTADRVSATVAAGGMHKVLSPSSTSPNPVGLSAEHASFQFISGLSSSCSLVVSASRH